MLKIINHIVAKIILFVAFLSLGIFFLCNKEKPSVIVDPSAQLIEELFKEIEMRWELGDYDKLLLNKKISCKDSPVNHYVKNREFLKCDFFYMDCYLKNLKRSDVIVKLKQTGYTLEVLDNLDFSASFKVQNREVYFKFKDTCKLKPLPEGIYKERDNSEIFDTFGQKIYIDGDYVPLRDYYLMNNNLSKIKTHINLSRPLTNQTLNEMKEICKKRKGKLLKAHLFDAATLIPSKDNHYYPYPWDKKSENIFLKQQSDLTFDKCQMAYVKGCEKLLNPLELGLGVNSASHIGLLNSIGGYLEALDNDYDKNKNLKLSSFYFDKNSKVHKLGIRGYWDGNAFNRENFKGLEDLKETSFEVSFRCYYEK